MKMYLSTLFAVFASFTANAMPSIGDTAQYDFTLNGATGKLTQSITAYDATTNSYTVNIITTYQGQTQTEQETREASQLLTDAQVEAMYAQCAELSGTYMKVTVPAGTYETCRLIQKSGDDSQTIYLAKGVAFGFVQVTTIQNGQNLDAQLVSQARGQ